jgi:hypothetical protein
MWRSSIKIFSCIQNSKYESRQILSTPFMLLAIVVIFAICFCFLEIWSENTSVYLECSPGVYTIHILQFDGYHIVLWNKPLTLIA